jgi:hypothetical protein
MCDFNEQIKGKNTVTGYKVVITDKYGHYYSPITGYRYKIGKVSRVNKYGKHAIYTQLHFRNILDKNDCCHNNQYYGMTAVFTDLNSAYDFEHLINRRNLESDSCAKEINSCILEMKLTGVLYNGVYDGNNVYIGSEIKSFKKSK